MSGRKQHEIPQLYLRGFLIDDRGDKEQVFQYRKGLKEPFPNLIKDACAQRDFNANAPTNDHRDLDGEITQYESRLGPLINGLRDIKDGESVDPQIVAEAVSHLTVRNAHIRGTFAYAFEGICDGISDVFCNQEGFAHVLGLDEETPAGRFHEIFSDAAPTNFAQIKIPIGLIEKIAFSFAKENLAKLAEQSAPTAEGLISQLIRSAPQMIRDGHNNALLKTFVPEKRISQLCEFTWKVVRHEQNLILPDCVAIVRRMDEQYCPLILADHDEVAEILIPLYHTFPS